MSNEKLKKVEDAFSERLKMLRKERGLSQEELAARLDVSPGSVGNWEIGSNMPHLKVMTKIAALFDVDVFYLWKGEESSRHVTMRERSPEYGALNLAELLREVEGARDALDRVAQQLRKAEVKPSAARGLVERASASYDERKKRA